MNEPVCMADIQNMLYEAGLFRRSERIVLSAENCVLLEYCTGKTYSYRMVELTTLKSRRLFSRQKPLTESCIKKR
jgi:ATP-dependent DNA helicase DinG